MNRRDFFGDLLAKTAVFTILKGAGRVWKAIRADPALFDFRCSFIRDGIYLHPLWITNVPGFSGRVEHLGKIGSEVIRPSESQRRDYILNDSGMPFARVVRPLDCSDLENGVPIRNVRQSKVWIQML